MIPGSRTCEATFGWSLTAPTPPPRQSHQGYRIGRRTSTPETGGPGSAHGRAFSPLKPGDLRAYQGLRCDDTYRSHLVETDYFSFKVAAPKLVSADPAMKPRASTYMGLWIGLPYRLTRIARMARETSAVHPAAGL